MNKNIFKQQYKRNQLEEGLYKYFMVREEFGSKVNAVGNPSDKFLSHFKRLINLDRKEHRPKGKYIFFEDDGQGAGKETKFSDFHVFLLGLALDFIHMGFVQKEVMFVLFNMKEQLREVFSGIHANKKRIAPFWNNNQVMGEVDGMLVDMNGNADFTVYLTFRRFEYYDWAVSNKTFDREDIQFVNPRVFWGIKELTKELQQAGNLMPSFVSFELADLAIAAPNIVAKVEPQKRGRYAMR